MSAEESNDSDVDIVLEEVSKIFRCKECQRCFISYTKFAEHFPVYHLQKILDVTGQKSSNEKTVSPASGTSKIVGARPRGPRSFQEKMLAIGGSPVTQRRTKISLKGNNQSNNNDTSCSLNTGKLTDYQDIGHHNVGSVPPAERNDIQRTSSQSENENGITEQVAAKSSSTRFTKTDLKANVVDQSNKKRKTTFENDSPKQVESQPKTNNVEVITLTDSDDDPCEPNLKTNEYSHVGVKQEVTGDQDNSSSPASANKEDTASDKSNEEVAVRTEVEEMLPSQGKRFFCTYCSKRFTRQRTLQSHIKGIHRSELEKEQLNNRLREQDESSMTNEKFSEKSKNNVTCNDIGDNEVRKRGGRGKRVKASVKVSPKMTRNATRKRKNAINSPVNEEASVNSIDNEEGEGTPLLAFSCKWCPERFVHLDSLKKHAINIHIKYKFV